jgi:DNA polymerase
MERTPAPALLTIRFQPEFESWQQTARPLLARRIRPAEILWRPQTAAATPGPESAPGPAREARGGADPGSAPVSIPRAFWELASGAACHRDQPGDNRWDLLYRIAYRLTGGEAALMEDGADPDVHRLRRMARSVERDVHRMQAFTRFRRVEEPGGGEHYIAWHRPEHHVLARVALSFADRFPRMRWSILTPEGSAHWNGRELRFGPGLPAAATPADDQLDDVWRTDYAALFHPGRLARRR